MSILHKLVETFMARLFEPEARRLQTRVNELDRMNGELRRERAYGFVWQGQTFRAEGAPHQMRRYPGLDWRFREEGNSLIADQKTVEDDKHDIKQTMYLLLKDCSELQDMRDALPEALVEFSSDLMKFSRTREPGYTLTDERHIRQFKALLGKIEFYSVAKLLY